MIEGSRMLISAFEPFAGRRVNGSASLAQHLANTLQAEVRVEVLPVVWGAPERRIPELVAQFRPQMILGLGEGKQGVAIETLAVNLRNGTDKQGSHLDDSLIAAHGPDQRSARFDLRLDTSRPLDLPILISRDAGKFLCNEAYYVSLSTRVRKVLFIHLPPQGNQTDGEYCKTLTPTILRIIGPDPY